MYTGWQTMEPWNYTKGENLSTYVAAKYVRRFMTEKLGKKCPRLVALPHGIQGKFWVTTPEAMAMEVTGFFLQGYHAAHLYLYPHGYDNRYWRVMAENNSLIALHEDVVFNGKRLTGKDPAMPLLGIHTEETRRERDTCTPVFITALKRFYNTYLGQNVDFC